DQEQIADLLVTGIDAELFLEALEHADRLEREANLGLGRELYADAAGGLARRPRADRLALDDDDVGEAAPGSIVGDAAAHHAATDHHRARRPGQVHAPMLCTRASDQGPICRSSRRAEQSASPEKRG